MSDVTNKWKRIFSFKPWKYLSLKIIVITKSNLLQIHGTNLCHILSYYEFNFKAVCVIFPWTVVQRLYLNIFKENSCCLYSCLGKQCVLCPKNWTLYILSFYFFAYYAQIAYNMAMFAYRIHSKCP